MKNSIGRIWILDLIAYIFTYLPNVIAWMTVIWFYSTFKDLGLWILLFVPVILPLSFIFACFILRLGLPKMRPGVFEAKMNPQFISWYLNLALGRAVRVGQLELLVLSSYNLKWLYWKVMGAKIAYGVNTSMYVNFIDLPLISIGRGSTLGDQSQISCHILTDKKLILSEVTIGENCFIGAYCRLYTGTKIGSNSTVGYGNLLNRKEFPEGSQVEAHTYLKVTGD